MQETGGREVPSTNYSLITNPAAWWLFGSSRELCILRSCKSVPIHFRNGLSVRLLGLTPLLYFSRPRQSMPACFTELGFSEDKNVDLRLIIHSGSSTRVGSLHLLVVKIVYRKCCRLLVVFSS